MRRSIFIALWCCGAPQVSPPVTLVPIAVAPSIVDASTRDEIGAVPVDSPDTSVPATVELKPVESTTPAVFGQSLEPGNYVFPDGLTLRVEQTANCDFDTSVPCYGGTYRARAMLGKKAATVEWSTRATKILNYKIELANFHFTVRK